MKKLVVILLAAVLILSLAACGTINKTEVSVLWSGDGVVRFPDSLINSIERAMYIENIAYKHYGANGDLAAQVAKAEEVLNAGCAALAVELVDASAAPIIVDLAKAKDVPVIFFNCDVDEKTVSGYAKCAAVSTDAASVGAVQGRLIGETVADNYKTYDRNGDNKITYLALGDVAASADAADAILLEKGKSVLGLAGEALSGEAGMQVESLTVTEGANADGDKVDMLSNGDSTVEMIITDDDAAALEVLTALQGKGFNATRLTTHCIPVFTVGAETDASSFADTEGMTEEELEVFVYNVKNVIDAGQLAGTAVEDYDTIAVTVAELLRSLLKGKDVTTAVVKVPYTAYAG